MSQDLSQLRICLQCRKPRFDHWVGKIPWRREWLPTPVFLPGEFHRQKSLVGYSPWGCKVWDTTERLTHTHTHVILNNWQNIRSSVMSSSLRPQDCSTTGLPVIRNSQSWLKLMSIESMMPSNHLILCQPLLLLPSIFPSIRVFSNESLLPIRRPK